MLFWWHLQSITFSLICSQVFIPILLLLLRCWMEAFSPKLYKHTVSAFNGLIEDIRSLSRWGPLFMGKFSSLSCIWIDSLFGGNSWVSPMVCWVMNWISGSGIRHGEKLWALLQSADAARAVLQAAGPAQGNRQHNGLYYCISALAVIVLMSGGLSQNPISPSKRTLKFQRKDMEM